MRNLKLIAPERNAVLVHFTSSGKVLPMLGKVIENGEVKEIKLCINQRFGLPNLALQPSRDVIVIAGIVTLEGTDYHYMAHYAPLLEGSVYQDAWINLIEPSGMILKLNINQREFITKCKNYCEAIGKTTDAAGNLIDGMFPLFQNIVDVTGFLRFTPKDNPFIWDIYTIMANNHFPVHLRDKNEVYFGTFIDDYRIHVLPSSDTVVRIQ